MNKRLLGIGLGLLTVALFLGPIAYAFYSNGWSVKETVSPSDEQISTIQNEIEGVLGGGSFSQDDFELVENEITSDYITLGFNLSSPFQFEVVLKEISFKISHRQEGVELATVDLESENISLEEGETKNITLSGETTEEGSDIIESSTKRQILANLEMSEMSFEFEAAGITLKF